MQRAQGGFKQYICQCGAVNAIVNIRLVRSATAITSHCSFLQHGKPFSSWEMPAAPRCLPWRAARRSASLSLLLNPRRSVSLSLVLNPRPGSWRLERAAGAPEPTAQAQPWWGCLGENKHERAHVLPTKHSCIITPCTVANSNSEIKGFSNMASNSVKHPACTTITRTRCLPSLSISKGQL